MKAQAKPAIVRRFVITHVDEDKGDLRRLTFSQQGRHTFEKREEAETALAAYKLPGGLDRLLTDTELQSLRVDEVDCYAGHFDPVRYYIEERAPVAETDGDR